MTNPPTRDVVRLGIIGLGAQGRVYADLIGSGRVPAMTVGAVCARNESHREFAADLGVGFHTDHIALLESGEVDAIVITVPHYEHPRIGIDALERGVHVLVEKPIGVYTKQAKQLLAAADRHPEATLAVLFNQRANPLYADLKALIESGELGALRHSTWTVTSWWRPDAYYTSSSWRATWGGEGGAVLVNQAPHQLDLWMWLCGVPRRCFARVQFGFRRPIATEDEVSASVDFGCGATGQFLTCTHDLIGTDRLEILFDQGRILVENSRTVTVWRLTAPEQQISASLSAEQAALAPSGRLDTSGYYSSTTREYTSVWGEQHAVVLQNFAEHILTGAPLIAPGAEGIHGVRLANAMLLSAWTGRDIDLTEFDDDAFLAELNARIAAEDRFPLRS